MVLEVLFFGSGATGLAYEIIWLRELILVFGSTTLATSAILSTYMAGLALGSLAAPVLLQRSTWARPKLYAACEILIALYAAATPVLFHRLPLVYAAILDSIPQSLVILSAVKMGCVAVILIPPTALMGATLPILAEHSAISQSDTASGVSLLYALNLLGAAAGTLVTGMALLPLLGVGQSLLATAATSLLIGLVALSLSEDRPPPASRPARIADSMRAYPMKEIRPAALWLLAGSTGCISMILEVSWTRLLALILGSSVYAFSLMLLAFLLALASGGLVFTRTSKSRSLTASLTLAGMLLAASGLLTALTTYFFAQLPRLFAALCSSPSVGALSTLTDEFAISLLVMFPVAFALGAVFPLLLRVASNDRERAARSVARTYASNVAGTILGSVATAFLLIPWLGTQRTILFAAVLQVGMAAVALPLLIGLRPLARLGIAASACAISVPFLLFPPEWDLLLMNSGGYVDIARTGGWDEFVEYAFRRDRVLYQREGLTASVLVAEREGGHRHLRINGKVEASSKEDLETQLLVGHLPMLIMPDARDALVIGLGSGITAGAVAAHPVENLAIIEIEEAVIEASAFFAPENRRVLTDPRSAVFVADARSYLAFTHDAFDVIISQPSNPWMTVAANLFTEDFFRLARARLSTGGIFSQWLHTYNLSADDILAILKAFRNVFAHVAVFRTSDGSDIILLGSQSVLGLDLVRIGQIINQRSLDAEFTSIAIQSPLDLIPLFVFGNQQVDALTAGVRPNSDDNARVEFSAPLSLRLYIRSGHQLLDSLRVSPLACLSELPHGCPAQQELRRDISDAWLRRGKPARAREVALDGGLIPACGNAAFPKSTSQGP